MPRHLVLQILLAFAVIVAGNVLVKKLAYDSVPRQKLLKGQRSEPATDLFLGNSVIAAGIDESAFAAAVPGRHPLNLGLGASGAVEHLLIYRQQQKHHSATVYFGFFDTQLTDIPNGDWKEMIGNRRLAYYVEPGLAAKLYHPHSAVGRFLFRTIAYIPWLIERQTVWAKVEKLRRRMGETGIPKTANNEFGRVSDFGLLEVNEEEFKQKCRRLVAEKALLSEPVAAIVSKAKEWGAQVFLIDMPMTSGHRKRYYESEEWQLYQAHFIELANQAGAQYVPAADWIDDDGFSDSLHLNQAGARELSTRLAGWSQGLP